MPNSNINKPQKLDMIWMLYFNFINKDKLDEINWMGFANVEHNYQKRKNFIKKIMELRAGTYILNNGAYDIRNFVERYKV